MKSLFLEEFCVCHCSSGFNFTCTSCIIYHACIRKINIIPANYTDVIERETGSPHRTVRFCVTSNTELAKCRVLRQAAFTRGIRPPFDCIQETTLHDCLKTVRDDGADVITLDGGEVVTAQRWVPVVIAKRVHLFPVDNKQERSNHATLPRHVSCSAGIIQ